MELQLCLFAHVAAFPRSGEWSKVFDIERAELVLNPVPHIVLHDAVTGDIFRDLVESAPLEALRAAKSPPLVPGTWSRMDADIVAGDPALDELIARSGAWGALYARAVSTAFVDEVLAKFGPALDAARNVLRVDPGDFHSAFHHETRAWLGGVNVADEVKRDPAPGVDSTALFSRFDVGIGEVGYEEKMHVGLRHRLFSAFYYVTGAAETETVGGDLEFYESRPMDAVHVDDVYDRNTAVLSLTPRPNTLVLFLATADSLHGVSRITAQRSPHLAVRLAISGRVQLWNDCVPSMEECVVSAAVANVNAAHGANTATTHALIAEGTGVLAKSTDASHVAIDVAAREACGDAACAIALARALRARWRASELAPLDVCEEDCTVRTAIDLDGRRVFAVARVARGASGEEAEHAATAAATRFCSTKSSAGVFVDERCRSAVASRLMRRWRLRKLRPSVVRPLRELPGAEDSTDERERAEL